MTVAASCSLRIPGAVAVAVTLAGTACTAQPSLDVTGVPGTATGDPSSVSGSGSEGASSTGIASATDATTATSLDSSASSGASDDGPVTLLDVGSAETGSIDDGCAEGNDVVAVLFESSMNPYTIPPQLHRFDTATGTFTLVATLECLWDDQIGQYQRVHGLAVDRQANAITRNYDDFVEFPLANPDACTFKVYDEGNSELSNPMSMAYAVLDPDDPESERMFLGNSIGQNLSGEALPGALGWGEIGDTTVEGNLLAHNVYIDTFLVGTGDGRLFGVGGMNNEGTEPVDIFVSDPATGTVDEVLFTWDTLPYPAFYGGDLLVVDRGTMVALDYESSVWVYDLDDDDGNGEHELTVLATDEVFPELMHPVGVASPTCIPTQPAG